MAEDKLTKISSLCRRRGFVFGGSEIYGGLSSIWDYGPLGAMLKKRIKDIWWKQYVEDREDIVGLDSSIIMHEGVFVASGHLGGFVDWLVDCPECKKRFRLDKIEKIGDDIYRCAGCRAAIDVKKYQARKFNLMFKTNMSASESNPQYAYLRPETAQGIFVNFNNVFNTMHKKPPFGIAQIGKAFRNEVTGGSFIFRMKEFEQMEIEYFVHPSQAEDMYRKWIDERFRFYVERIGLRKHNLRLREHMPDELAHYAKGCTDIEFNFSFLSKDESDTDQGWSELEGIANRGDFDLVEHSRGSKKDLSFFDDRLKEKYVPFVIEPSAGVDRTFLAIIADAFHQEDVRGKIRTVLKLKPKLAPYTAAVFPLLKNNADLVNLAKNIFRDLHHKLPVIYDDTAAIGKLYRRQDEIGTPFCITVDVESLTDNKVTVRNRDTMAQERVEISKITNFLGEEVNVF